VDEAGRVRIGSDEKGKFVIPTNQGSGMTARLGSSSQQGFGPRAGSWNRMASRMGSGASPTSSEYYWKQELFWMPVTNGCRIWYPQRILNEETQNGLTAKLPWGARMSK